MLNVIERTLELNVLKLEIVGFDTVARGATTSKLKRRGVREVVFSSEVDGIEIREFTEPDLSMINQDTASVVLLVYYFN